MTSSLFLDHGLYDLIEEVEQAMPEGWSWVVRKSPDEDGPYFANIYPPEGGLRFSCYGNSPYDALLKSLAKFRAG